MSITIEGDCHLNSSFSCLIQFLLAIFAFSSLIYKYSVEEPQRPFRIFQLDAGKMAIGGGTSHILNLVFSMAWSDKSANPCVWFFLGVIVDSTVGIFLCYVLLEVAECYGAKRGIHVRGSYGDPISMQRWGVQCFFWAGIVILSKLLTTMMLYVDAGWWTKIGNSMLSPWEKMPRMELVVAVLITPFMCNVFAFWVMDSFLQGLVEIGAAKYHNNNKYHNSKVHDSLLSATPEQLETEEQDSLLS
eukprot:TRINITY_DN1302_c0_g1_i1.p1 TRINITY_DN1302_c0_g1~~TRINITY_DN1302_c0_g1_i1.p1  ORF type:complete len:245 (-),score=52.15 TRINITY_DN1302_c0_g1_i1:250-984(-)